MKGYFAELAIVLGSRSEVVADAGLNAAMRASPNFPPPVPLVEQHCAGLIDGVEFARTWRRGAQLQLAEREQREHEDQLEPLEHRRAVVARILGELHAKISTPGRRQHEAFKRFSAEQLQAMYKRPEPKPKP